MREISSTLAVQNRSGVPLIDCWVHGGEAFTSHKRMRSFSGKQESKKSLIYAKTCKQNCASYAAESSNRDETMSEFGILHSHALLRYPRLHERERGPCLLHSWSFLLLLLLLLLLTDAKRSGALPRSS